MRTLLLLRGSAGCGKSTWIEQNRLKPYTLCADDIRLMCSSPQLNVEGKTEINQKNDATVWAMLFKLLEIRMQHGEFTVIDATNSKTSEMNRYKELCMTYKYRIYCVDFTDIPIEVVKERNRNRAELKRVPDAAIDKMYARFATQKIPSGITVIKPDELDKVWLKKIDLSEYRRIHVIGDVHGCNTVLQEYLTRQGGMSDEDFYIFVGDYTDRGIENVEVINFLLTIYEKKNVLLLEGNHEHNLWVWANGGVAPSKEFELVTKTQFENGGVDKKSVRKLYRRMGQCAYFSYQGNTYLVTHGGLSTLPTNLTLCSTEQMIKGVGNYNNIEVAEESFARTTTQDVYQIHGHRNPKGNRETIDFRNYNLEGKVEFGGGLRCAVLYKNGSSACFQTENTVFKPRPMEQEKRNMPSETVGDAIIALRKNKYIQEKPYGNISSFNFTKSAFYDKAWDEQTTKARGLYINIPEQKVIARAYEKFFNINERAETKFDMLQYKLNFPVTAYVKENGFLGIAAYNDEDDSLFITTKSSPDGDFAVWFRNLLQQKLSANTLNAIKVYSKEHNVSFVFECVDMEHDPHIIDYAESQVFLLDIVYNDLAYHKVDFETLCNFADVHGIQHKEKAFVLDSWSDFFDWYYTVTNEDYLYNGRHIEGFVLEDANGYMVKIKLAYYNFWKFMRAVSHEAIRKGYIDPRRTSGLTTALANQYYGWVKTLHDREDRDQLPKDICTLRKMFFETEQGKAFLE